MSATAVKENRSKGAAVPETEEYLAERIEQISSGIPAAEQRVAELKSEREKLVIPARVDRDAAAQKRIRTIDEELLSLEHDLSDDRAALQNLSNRLQSAKNARIAAEWEGRREGVRKSIARRISQLKSHSLEEATKLFIDALKEADEEDRRIAAAVIGLHRNLRHEANAIEARSGQRGELLGRQLQTYLPIDGRIFIERFQTIDLKREHPDPSDADLRAYSEALEAVNQLEIVF